MSSQVESLSQFQGISREEKEKLVGEVIRHVLFKSHQNSGCPLKWEELAHIVNRNYKNKNLSTLVINEARAKLSAVFGYRLVELHRSRPSSTNQSRAAPSSTAENRSYVLMSELPDDLYWQHVEDTDAFLWSGLAFVVISVVHLAGGKIHEDNLWHHLRRLGLHENDENHEHFGNLKQALHSLVSQRYLQKNRVPGPEGSNFFYELAERALDANVTDKLKKYILQIVKKDAASEDAD
ncbi:hypothetical protein MLD38_034558 [Melastoma candidum]|uniref:Uncharacterized protein n=1 Tax=Melastoma candidum TaxID=119954 RepID=A0ACB9MCD3_9MYRT|nr:hypothetical protein MLD38_034558 [Melastoma candidum]